MHFHPIQRNSVSEPGAVMSGRLLRRRQQLDKVVRTLWRHLSDSKLCWAALAAVAAVVALATLKLSAVLHGLLRLADAGANVTSPVAAAMGAAAAGAAGGAAAGGPQYGPPNPFPPRFIWFTPHGGLSELHSGPSNDSPVISHPPSGMRVVATGAVNGADGQPSWYIAPLPGNGSGYVQASEVSTTRPEPLPASHPVLPIDPNERIVISTGSATSGARG